LQRRKQFDRSSEDTIAKFCATYDHHGKPGKPHQVCKGRDFSFAHCANGTNYRRFCNAVGRLLSRGSRLSSAFATIAKLRHPKH
jgi:hypothetical protein